MSKPMSDDLLSELVKLAELDQEQPGDVTVTSFAEAFTPPISHTTALNRLRQWVAEGRLIRVRVKHSDTKQPGYVYRRPPGSGRTE
jgi:hypothetical protein